MSAVISCWWNFQSVSLSSFESTVVYYNSWYELEPCFLFSFLMCFKNRRCLSVGLLLAFVLQEGF